MITAIAIDDEPIALEIIKGLSEKVLFMKVEKLFTNALEAMAYLQTNKVDLLFLDIKMPDISGIDFLKSLSNPPFVIFTTAFSEHAVESFELDVVDYLLKPFSLARFMKACNKCYELHQLKQSALIQKVEEEHLFIKSGYEDVKVVLSDILYVEGSGNYVVFVLQNKKIPSRLTMNEAEQILPGLNFKRIHRSFIVALKHIEKKDKRSVWINENEIPIGKLYQSDIQDIIS